MHSMFDVHEHFSEGVSKVTPVCRTGMDFGWKLWIRIGPGASWAKLVAGIGHMRVNTYSGRLEVHDRPEFLARRHNRRDSTGTD